MLGDHYDPSEQAPLPFDDVYHTPSVAALGIAAHEAGHAIQHARAYGPLKARMALVPVTMFASQMLPFVILGGLFFQITGPHPARHLLLPAIVAFQLITLPVEFDASKRAKVVLGHMGISSQALKPSA
jgi:Zn-dependent membrane protease YugP